MNLLQARIEATAAHAVCHCGPLSLPVPDAYANPLPRYDGTAVVLGIRPEDIYDRDVPGGIPLDAKIVAIEALGPETVVVGEIAGVAELSVRLGRGFSAPIGSVQRFYLDPNQIHLFDAQTTLAIAPAHGNRA